MEALGVESEIEDIRVGWSSVDVEGLRKSSLILRRSIEVNFVVEGDVNNPQFSLNLQHALASSTAESLGVSLGGVAKGVGALGQSGVEAAGKAAKGTGSAVQRLFGGQKKR